MSDFEPVFRDGIGYCNALCRCAWDTEQEDRVIRFCGHDCSPSAPPARNDTVCNPWVRSLLARKPVHPLIGVHCPAMGGACWAGCPQFAMCAGASKDTHPIPDEKVSEAVRLSPRMAKKLHRAIVRTEKLLYALKAEFN